MKKKKAIGVGAGALTTVVLGLVMGCVAMASPYGAAKADEVETQNATFWNAADINKISTNVEQILEKGTKDFFKGYSVDESFLLWLENEYGDETLACIADYINNAGCDSNEWYIATGKSMHVLWADYCASLIFTSYRYENVDWVDNSNSDDITLDFVGDVNFADDWYTMTASNGDVDGAIDDAITAKLKEADITMLNNEFTYSKRGTAIPGKAYVFKADPSTVSNLSDVFGADIVSLANNHVCDFGDDALLDTMDTLTDAGITYIGAGQNIDQASQIHYFICKGKKIAYVSATQIERTLNYTKEATETSPGVLKTLDPTRFKAVIARAKANSDYVIAYVHWGTEGKLTPDSDVRLLAESFVNAGADCIIGNHTHRLQGLEYINGVPVVWSLGNFWFSTGSMYATVAQVDIDKDGILSLSLLPCEQANLKTRLLDKDEAAAFYQYVADLSTGISIDESGKISAYDINAAYSSAMNYSVRSGEVDNDGNGIDIVGNIISE